MREPSPTRASCGFRASRAGTSRSSNAVPRYGTRRSGTTSQAAGQGLGVPAGGACRPARSPHPGPGRPAAAFGQHGVRLPGPRRDAPGTKCGLPRSVCCRPGCSPSRFSPSRFSPSGSRRPARSAAIGYLFLPGTTSIRPAAPRTGCSPTKPIRPPRAGGPRRQRPVPRQGRAVDTGRVVPRRLAQRAGAGTVSPSAVRGSFPLAGTAGEAGKASWSSGRGSHQFALPSSSITAGTSTSRTTRRVDRARPPPGPGRSA